MKHQKEQPQHHSLLKCLPKGRGLTNTNSHVQKVKVESFIWNTSNEFWDLKKEYLQSLKMQATRVQRRRVVTKEISRKLEVQVRRTLFGRKRKSWSWWQTSEIVRVGLTWLTAWQGLPSEAELQFSSEWTVCHLRKWRWENYKSGRS